MDKPADSPPSPTVGAMFRQAYDELRQLAAAKLARLPPGQTLSPTALVHEVYARMLGKADVNFRDDREFFIVVAVSMRDVLVERARHKMSQKGGGGRNRVPLEQVHVASDADDDTLLDIDQVVERLKQQDETGYQIVMLRFFAGLTEEQTAAATGMSLRTLQRRWKYLRAMMYSWITLAQSH